MSLWKSAFGSSGQFALFLERFATRESSRSEEVERVRSLPGYALRRHWQAVFGRSAPKHLTAELRRRMIAMRIQEEAFGTLDTAALKALDKLAGRNLLTPDRAQ